MGSIHLVCNAHLDPTWLWQWEEGAAAAIGTFRAAAEFCEEYDGFVFNHNEAILYRWVEEYDPVLFAKIQQLVRMGKWHIMGGWHLQPDCNMPSGESFVRQILLGRRYFREKFAARPTVACNFDPFGHSRGLVQILAKSGYTGYLFCRPGQDNCRLAGDEFIWEGFDGSRILAVRASAFYNSALGKAGEKLANFIKTHAEEPVKVMLWGVGNHGGGPSRLDIETLDGMSREHLALRIRHSTPEDFFAELADRAETLPHHAAALNPWAPGCYTSQVRVKQKHRLLENELFATEKMITAAWCQDLLAYPAADLEEAFRDLAMAEFHDILPGSSIQPVEEDSLRLLGHGLEIVSRLKARAFFALAAGEKKARDGEIPILVYNPHPYPIETSVECEFQLADINWEDSLTDVTVFQGEQALPSQVEKELSNLTLDWRKRVVFRAKLAPAQMNRFDCRLNIIPGKPVPGMAARSGRWLFHTEELDIAVNMDTGLLDRYCVRGIECLAPHACRAIILEDNEDPWGMSVRGFTGEVGEFSLLAEEESASFAGIREARLPPVRVIEDGPVRTVVEALFGYGDSRLCLRYKLPKHGTEIELEIRVFWNEKNSMLKLELPTLDPDARYRGQVAYGVDALPNHGDEAIAQKWVSAISDTLGTVLTVINDGIYGSDCLQGRVRLTLLRSPAYAGHPIGERVIVPQDRFSPRIDQGERFYRFWLNGGPAGRRLAEIDREAMACNEKPMVLSYFPSGGGKPSVPFAELEDEAIQLTAAKQAEHGHDLILRLFEPTGQSRATVLRLPFAGLEHQIELGAFEIRTYRVDLREGSFTLIDLMEEPS